PEHFQNPQLSLAERSLQSNTETRAKRRYYTSKKGKNSRVSLSIIAFPAFLKCFTALERCVTVPGKMNENSFIIEINSVSSQ
ncbi:MAG: hypothetical protein NTY44_09845, partial [Deltaproteobacteria bacterium]|nr:hypothetical protein [Deltaproteobacteria bacterium]